MKKFLATLLVLIPMVCRAEQTKTKFNPFTGKLDYITQLSTVSIGAGTGISISTNSNGVTITATGAAASSLGTAYNGVLVSTPTGGINVVSPLVNYLVGSTPTFSVDLSTTLAASSATVTYVQISSANANFLTQANAASTYATIASSTNFIYNTSALQSGATFYVSSGTVNAFDATTIAVSSITSLTNKNLNIVGTQFNLSDPNNGGAFSDAFNFYQKGTLGASIGQERFGIVGPPGRGSALYILNGPSIFYLNGSTNPSAVNLGPQGIAGIGSLQDGTTFFVNGNMAVGAAGATVSTGPVPTDSLMVYGQIIGVSSVTLQNSLLVSSATTLNGNLIISSTVIDGSGSAGTSGQFLSSQGPGTTTKWATASGSGDMVLASTQVATGAKTWQSSSTFNGAVLISTSVSLNGTVGTNGQVFTSGGPGAVATWTTSSAAGGGVTVPSTFTWQGVIISSLQITSTNGGLTVSSAATFNGNVIIPSTVVLSNGSGTSGQVMTSGGGGTSPTWTTLSSAGLASTQTWTGQNNWTTPAQSTFTYGLTVGSLTVSCAGCDWPSFLRAADALSYNFVASSSALTIGHLLVLSSTSGAVIDGGAPNAGSGDMVLASTQVATGGKTWQSSSTFNGAVIVSTSISAGGVGTNGQVLTSGGPGATVSWATLTAAQLTSTQTWTAQQTFNNTVIISTTIGLSTLAGVGTAGQVLTSQGPTSVPTWSSAGAGDMILASTQVVTGGKTFISSTTFSSTTVMNNTAGLVFDSNTSLLMPGASFYANGAVEFKGTASSITFAAAIIISTSISLNGATNTGTSGQFLTSQGQGIPTWGDVNKTTYTWSAQETHNNTIIISTSIGLSTLGGTGTSGQVLTSQGGATPIWTTPAVGTITGVVGGTGMAGSGSPIVTLTAVSTTAYTSSTQTWTAGQTFVSSITVTGGGGITNTFGLTSGSGTFTTSLSIPNGSAPSVTGSGMIGMDTSAGQLIAWDGLTANVVGVSTRSFTVTISSGIGWDNLIIPIWRAPTNASVTLTKILAESLPASTTVQYALGESAFGSINTSSSTIFSVAFSSANNTGVTTTTFADNSIASQASLVLYTKSSSAAAGTPSYMTITVYYKEGRQ